MRDNVSKPKREILPLTSIRGIAAMWVVAFHVVSLLVNRGLISQPNILVQNIVDGGSGIAVDIFFVLSGYILAENYGTISNSGTFFSHRAARVLPLHFVVLTAMAFGVAAMEHFGILPESENFFSWSTLPYQFVLINVWFKLQGWNGPTWSLNAELAAYSLFPAFQWTARKLTCPTLYCIGALFIFSDFALFEIIGFEATGLSAIARGILGFGGGMMLYLALRNKPLPNWLPPACVLAISGLACFNQYSFAIFPITLLILALGASEGGAVQHVMSVRILVWLGRVSYSVYLLHVPILIVGMQILRRMPILNQSSAGIALWSLSYLVIMLSCAEFTWRFIEMPARRVIRDGSLRLARRSAEAP